MAQPDPFMLRDGLKTNSQLAEIRKTGKQLEKYHRRQNDVCHNILYSLHLFHFPLSSSSPC